MRRRRKSKRSVLMRAYELLNSEAGRNLQQQEVWKNNNIRIDGSDDKSLEEALNPERLPPLGFLRSGNQSDAFERRTTGRKSAD